MPEQIETLRRLQDVDGQLFELRRQLQQKPQALARFKETVQQEQAAAQAVEAKLKAVQLQQKEKEMELATREGTTKKLQGQLFQVKTNKEYTAIQHEIEQSKADASLLEEEIIKLLEAVEQASKEHKAQVARVGERQAELRTQEQQVAREMDELKAQVATLERRRQEIVPLIERDALSFYERILANREGVAMVPLVGNSCSGCQMIQPPQVVHEVKLNARLVTCQTCTRILYLDQYADSTRPA